MCKIKNWQPLPCEHSSCSTKSEISALYCIETDLEPTGAVLPAYCVTDVFACTKALPDCLGWADLNSPTFISRPVTQNNNPVFFLSLRRTAWETGCCVSTSELIVRKNVL